MYRDDGTNLYRDGGTGRACSALRATGHHEPRESGKDTGERESAQRHGQAGPDPRHGAYGPAPPQAVAGLTGAGAMSAGTSPPSTGQAVAGVICLVVGLGACCLSPP